MEHMVLPSDLLASLLTWTDPRTVSRFTCTSSAASAATNSSALWLELYENRWRKAGSMIKENLADMEEDVEETEENLLCPVRWLYRQRQEGAVPLAVVNGVHVLEGHLRSAEGGKSTPIRAVLGFQRGRVGGYAQKTPRSTGTKSHKSATATGAPTATAAAAPQPECAWVGMLGPDNQTSSVDSARSGWIIRWEETSGSGSDKTTRSFTGEFAPDGMSISGTFDDTASGPCSKMMKKKSSSGTFILHAQFPSATAPTFMELSRTILQLLQPDEEIK
mmetsp:Transcript_22500/g.52323  ORF Transcript_22500/g.52323 Transcript_22500/m.52323 type:complete len:276 (-) Transcript_22500:190-1017(-)|eukprot:CAMPEP_0178443076 /NCGR_PEP_ID=MMETSP0689_2-20121128/38616_1 /TAXON_ID=160604 /ORGANISM="Amphidinium massartii, Strain CS-259" /LENGTH=275 /DNA_ID=CAMNT_0020066887 /DNA_START=72 /DNA_END=899 /DNA_ORIENTATION=-